ncbi:MAG: TfpX/TfpZ family type IV pilin accessory protein [Dokdonella sp.]
MSRWKAASIHILISLAVGLIVGSLLLFVWYPPPFFHAAGADVLVVLMVGVDLALGPLLTLVVFKSGKRALKFDLALIGLMQAAALVYGLSIVLLSRPVFLLAVVDRFELISASDLDPADLAKGPRPEFRSLSFTGPRLGGVQMPASAQDRDHVLFSSVGGKDIDKFPEYYVDYAVTADGLLKHAKPLDTLKISSREERTALDDALAGLRKPVAEIVWVPLTALKANIVMLLDRSTGQPLRAVAVNPWPN